MVDLLAKKLSMQGKPGVDFAYERRAQLLDFMNLRKAFGVPSSTKHGEDEHRDGTGTPTAFDGKAAATASLLPSL